MIAAIYLCGVAKARNCIVAGAKWDPMVANHFYENVNLNKIWPWSTDKLISTTKSFAEVFSETKFWKTDKKSYVPFDYKDIREFL